MSVTPAEAAQELLRIYDAAEGMEAFTAYTTPRWISGRIHREVARQLDRVVAGEIDRLMLLCPPQHGKSGLASRRFPAYLLGRNPTLDVISGSATADLAAEFGRDVRDCVDSHEYQNIFPGVTLAEDSQARGRWHTKAGGSYYAVGVGGTLFGKGGLALVDDPFASWEDAQSETQRDRVWGWYQGTLYNRVRPGQPIIVIQHRMHEDDLAGRLIRAQEHGGDKWEIVTMPALLDDPPWPERYDRAALERIKANTTPLQWSALYLQDPVPAEGTFFQRAWFRRYRVRPEGMHYYASSDHAPAGDEGNDANCFRIWGVDSVGDLYLVDGFRENCTMDRFAERVVGRKGAVGKPGVEGLLARYKPLCWFPEDDNNWKAVAGFVTKMMREEGVYCRIEPISPHGRDKPAKAQAFQGMASMGRVWLPEGPEGDEVLTQYLSFPGAKHDDEVDVAGTIGRALAEAHPAVAFEAAAQEKPDAYERAEEESEAVECAI